MAKYNLPYVITRVFTLSLTIYSECFLPGCFLPVLHIHQKEKPNRAILYTYISQSEVVHEL